MAKKESGSKIQKFVSTFDSAGERCLICKREKGKVDSDLEEWLDLWELGEAGQTTWSALCSMLNSEYKLLYSPKTYGRHATRCLKRSVPIKV